MVESIIIIVMFLLSIVFNYVFIRTAIDIIKFHNDFNKMLDGTNKYETD